ncbi:E3 SUMO-protein ligase NSE2-like [Coccinella septempunctata]|uniref:E3 SUMO-protein ligase NSE2-like n=1 Tax=Coccinella septempunctata TaxID=41139 RepID=UPI001D08E388|nr:E3 SUMO-protein ligase NSE2-like [Coccinella septempunctata]
MSSHSYENILGHCVDSLRSCKELSDKYLEDDTHLRSIIQKVTMEYVEENFDKEKADRALLKLKNDLNEHENADVDIEALYKKYVEEDETELIHNETDIWKEIFSGTDIQEVLPKNERLSDANFDRVDDSLLCSNVFKPPIDPISKVVIKEPYKNLACGHYFDYGTILNYIKERRGRAKCPYVGCTNSNFRAEHLKLDERMKQQVELYLQNNNDAEDSSDNE